MSIQTPSRGTLMSPPGQLDIEALMDWENYLAVNHMAYPMPLQAPIDANFNTSSPQALTSSSTDWTHFNALQCPYDVAGQHTQSSSHMMSDDTLGQTTDTSGRYTPYTVGEWQPSVLGETQRSVSLPQYLPESWRIKVLERFAKHDPDLSD